MTPKELEVWKELNELEVVKKAKGEWLLIIDYCVFNDGNGYKIDIYTNEEWQQTDCYWVPRLSDPIRPERSLWGMSEDIRSEWSIVQAGIFIASERPDLYLAEAIIEGCKG